MTNKKHFISGKISQHLTVLTYAFFIALQCGCATISTPKIQHQNSLGKVAVVASLQQPEIKLEGFPHGKAAGAAIGAGGAILFCAGFSSISALWVGCAPCFNACSEALVPVGIVIVAAASPNSEIVHGAERKFNVATDALTIQDALRDQVVSSALARKDNLIAGTSKSFQIAAQNSDYRSLSSEGVDTVLEVSLIKVGTEHQDPSDTAGLGFDPPLCLSMTAHVRLIRTTDNLEIFSADYVYQGKTLYLAGWASYQAEPLLSELKLGYETLGSHIYNTVFILYPFPDRSLFHSYDGQAPKLSDGRNSPSPQEVGYFKSSVFGLAPIDPPTRGRLGTDDLLGINLLLNKINAWFTVDSLQPTLRWEAFPRSTDITIAPEDMSRITNIRYDLIIAREEYLAPAEVIYRREGLPSPSFTIETPLISGTNYFWTVRARFILDGRERITEWGGTPEVRVEGLTSPSQWSYRFRTP
jgi:hypothetical protein